MNGVEGFFCQNLTPPQDNPGCFNAEFLAQLPSGPEDGGDCRNIAAVGTPFGDLRPRNPMPGVLASVFCIPQTGADIINVASDLPGPGAVTLPATLELVSAPPPPGTTTTSTVVGATTTTTTAPPALCGNGVVDPGERCDPDAPGVDHACCSTSCAVVGSGTACRVGTSACDVTEYCDGNLPVCPADVVASSDQSCVADDDGCTVEDHCEDGACAPGRRVCDAAVVPFGRGGTDAGVDVTCFADRAVDCEVVAQTIETPATARRTDRCNAPGGTTRLEPVRLTRKKAATLLGGQVGAPPLQPRRVLRLRLNKAGRGLLRCHGALDVSLVVGVRHGDQTVETRALAVVLRRRR